MNWQNVTVKLSDLQPWEHNPRTMTKKQAQRLLKSWKELGQFQTIAIGPSDNGSGCPVYDGHQRLSALLAAYGAQYAIDARQSDRALTEDERRYLITQANLPVGAWRFEEIAGWPEAQEWGFDAEMLQTWNSDAASLATMLEAEQLQGDADAEPQIDRAAELNEKWQVKTGDLWRIGEHRLLCGDSTKREDVERVMGGEKAGACVTDSPYGINRDRIENDDPEGLRGLFDGVLSAMPIDNGVVINFQSPRLFPVWLDAIRKAGHKFERMLWMYKPNDETFPWRGWLQTSEAIIVSSRGNGEWLRVDPFAHDCYSPTTLGSELPKEWGKVHASVKPLVVVQDLISRVGGDVYEPFAGSGTTLIGCENLGRVCFALESKPVHCAVILERMATAFPGIEIERISEAVLTHGT